MEHLGIEWGLMELAELQSSEVPFEVVKLVARGFRVSGLWF